MDIVIIGAGPAGLATAIQASRQGHRVRILEAGDRPGKKLLATGNGRCNYSNENISIDRYHGTNHKFAYSALARFGFEAARDFFAQLGMDTRILSKGRAYPRSLQSSSVLKVLLMEAQNLGVDICYQAKVDQVSQGPSGQGFVAQTPSGSYQADKLVLACGGMTLKNSGSDGSGYALARGLGHEVTDLGPGIVQMELKGFSHKAMSGTRFDGLLSLYKEENLVYADEDEILFTDYGISGPAVLQLSRRALDIIKEGSRAYFTIDLFPEYSHEDLQVKLAYDLDMSKNSLAESFIGKINDQLIGQVLEGFDQGQRAAQVSYKQIQGLVSRLKAWSFEIKGARSFDGAQVTAGGVATRDIDPSTMESLLVPGLYFVGEIMDIDGDCGGYNLHWAWASAHAAGSAL